MIKILELINKKINKKTTFILQQNKKRQIDYMKEFDVSKLNYLERSYNQYRCQVMDKSKFQVMMLNAIAVLGIIPLIMIFLIKNFINNNINKDDNSNKIAVFYGKDKNIIPNSLIQKYKVVKYEDLFILSKRDIKFIIKEVLMKKPFNPYFDLKIIAKVAIYSGNVNKHNAKAVISTSEYSFTSSILTKYCNENEILHINIMHGDKLFNIRDSFFRFNKCYIWDNHYKELFIKMNAYPKQFIVEIPEYFLLDNDDEVKVKNGTRSNLTYYLQSNSEEELIEIRERLIGIINKFSINIRPHPRYSNMDLVNKIFKDFNIENAKVIDIKQSIMQSDYIVSLYSTVLWEGYLYAKNIVVDDLVNKEYYEKLKELDYIIMNKKHIRMSELIEEVNGKELIT